jgi:hypothetical protein
MAQVRKKVTIELEVVVEVVVDDVDAQAAMEDMEDETLTVDVCQDLAAYKKAVGLLGTHEMDLVNYTNYWVEDVK